MKHFIVSEPAERDLEQIQDYLVQEAGRAVARRVTREIRRVVRFLAAHPSAGHLRPDLSNLPLRFWTVYSYVIVYDGTSKPIQVVRILHGARDIPSLL
jgi:antitoxin ParD1/3/4/toxin ParE1/3/4